MRKVCLALCVGVTFPALAGDFEDRLGDYNRCYTAQIERFAASCEPADQLAVAIVRGCPEELRHFESAAIGFVGVDNGRELARRLLETREQQAIASLMRRRLDKPCG